MPFMMCACQIMSKAGLVPVATLDAANIYAFYMTLLPLAVGCHLSSCHMIQQVP
jgi:hypothetical protein